VAECVQLDGPWFGHYAGIFNVFLLECIKGDLPQKNHFITLQIDGQSPNLFYLNYITETEKNVTSNDTTNET
jgi:hypothetical protein